MTTITFEKDFSLSRNEFKDPNEFLSYYIENYNITDSKVEF
jgi:hypothetical protein